MNSPGKDPELPHDQIAEIYNDQRQRGLLHSIMELLTPVNCRLITRSLDECGSLCKLNSEGEQFLIQFLSLCRRQDLWDLESETFRRKPDLNFPGVIKRMQEASQYLLEANDQCKALPQDPEPTLGFPDDVWENMVTAANETLIAYQSILHATFREFHFLCSYL
jgi:hypothetical protein